VSGHFQYPSNIIIKEDGLYDFNDLFASEIKRLFVITGKGAMKENHVLTRLGEKALKNNILMEVHSGIETNPSNLDADNAVKHCLDFSPDTVMGLGGGSSLDIAKIVAMIATNGGSSWDYISMTGNPGKEIKKEILPLILVPTTSGTGSETTPFAVITNSESNIKKGMGHSRLYPNLVIIDPKLLALMPEKLVSITGLDAFGQALEGFTSGRSTLFSEQFGWAALEMIIENLEDSFYKKDNLNAKAKMAWGTALSGLSIGLVDVNLAHALSHPLSGHYNIQHGHAVAMCTAPAINYNRHHVGNKYIRVASLLGYKGENKDTAADTLIDHFIKWNEKFGLDLKLGNFAEDRNDIPMLAMDALEVGAIKTNVRNVEETDVINLFNEVWNGRIG
tara:strand:+ start:9455 stop:10627 length:1173 start_codon:yes stop_codon:yes gene_type:complete